MLFCGRGCLCGSVRFFLLARPSAATKQVYFSGRVRRRAVGLGWSIPSASSSNKRGTPRSGRWVAGTPTSRVVLDERHGMFWPSGFVVGGDLRSGSADGGGTIGLHSCPVETEDPALRGCQSEVGGNCHERELPRRGTKRHENRYFFLCVFARRRRGAEFFGVHAGLSSVVTFVRAQQTGLIEPLSTY